jgi:endonuclease/exonuclease/phosphatase (EEP) superfamily protein YafD
MEADEAMGASTVSAGREARSRPRLLRNRTWLCRLAALPFLAACCGAVALAAFYHWPRASALTYYFVVRPAFVWFGMLAPGLAFGLFALRFRWFLVGCAAFALALATTEEVLPLVKPFGGRARREFWAARMAERSFENRDPQHRDGADVPLRLVTWNVRGGSMGAKEAIGELAALDPDVVLFQEFQWGGDAKMRDAIAASEEFASYSLDGGGNAILSRFPIERASIGPLGRGLGAVWRVEVRPGRAVTCVSVHLTPTDLHTQVLRGWSVTMLRDGVKTASRELAQVRAALEQYARQGPVILAGDFNLPGHYPDLRQATRHWQDCFARAGRGWGGTAPARLPAMRVDMIFVPEQARVYYAAAVPTRHSDHYPVLAEVVLPAAVAAR